MHCFYGNVSSISKTIRNEIDRKMYQRFLDKVSIQIIQELIKLWIRFDSGVNFIQKKKRRKNML